MVVQRAGLEGSLAGRLCELEFGTVVCGHIDVPGLAIVGRVLLGARNTQFVDVPILGRVGIGDIQADVQQGHARTGGGRHVNLAETDRSYLSTGRAAGSVVVDVLAPLVLILIFLGGVVALLAAARRAYLLARYLTTRPRLVDAVDLEPGCRWLRLTGEVTVKDPLDGPTDADIAAYQVMAHRQERLAGVSWPRTHTSLLSESAHTSFGLRAPGQTLHIAGHDEGSDAIDVVGGNWNEKGVTYTPVDPPPDPLAKFLRARGVDPATKLNEGHVFDHDLRVNATAASAGDTARLFGRFEVHRNGSTELVPLSGLLNDACLTTDPWRTLPVKYLHEYLRALLGGLFLVAVSSLLLWPDVAALVESMAG